MERDIAAESVAALGLLNGAVTITETGDGAAAVSVNALVPLAMEPGVAAIAAAGTFHDAMRAVASALSALALSAPDTYSAMLADASAGGTRGWLACAPVGGLWPDAMLPVEPAKMLAAPSNRAFPLYHHAVAVCGDVPEGADLESWCSEDHGRLAFSPAGEGMAFFSGWSTAAGRVVRFAVVLQDFGKPWTVIANADGSDRIAPASPMVLVDPVANAWSRPDGI